MMRFFRRRPAAAVYHCPLDGDARTAILTGGFQSSRSIRVFPEGWSDAVARCKPASIAAPLELLLELAERGQKIDVSCAVVAFTHDAGQRLDDDDRDLLWSAFGVPVFEQYLDAHNELLATECDAHNGLHVVGGCHGLAVDRTPCACGNSAPRLLGSGIRLPELELARA